MHKEKKEGGEQIPYLGLSGEFGFGDSAHVDQITAPCSVHETLGAGGELRALHAHDAFIGEERDALAVCGQGLADVDVEPAEEVG